MAKKEKEVKTNAMRILEREHIPYESISYKPDGEFESGVQTADKLGLPRNRVYKTLVASGSDRNHYVFVIPIESELDVRKCAKSVGVKSLELVPVKELFALTGYVRGGCTSIGMKKAFVTRLHESARQQAKIYVSAGRIGAQLLLSPEDLLRANRGEYADLIRGSAEEGAD
ncbi:Cys-tRNA(Pro) deacylase [Lachnoclostridium sp. Marseille-P6806]|uniref:Cys-tRNA(Pro) deacylase n=1 Tax=Lachnoclostridium sp. Marseille-P6806 TaxID=2364793 RepID=UPI00102FE897|nr:Cys-tRNA(Pro) deacylase [Lachnoclostridium sp. Marseille-P6806]